MEIIQVERFFLHGLKIAIVWSLTFEGGWGIGQKPNIYSRRARARARVRV